MTNALAALTRAVDGWDMAASRQGAIDVGQSSLDLLLRYRPAWEVNLGRMDLRAAQLLVDAAARDRGAVNGDVFTLVYMRDRILKSIGSADLGRINARLLELQEAAIDGDLQAAATATAHLREVIAGMRP